MKRSTEEFVEPCAECAAQPGAEHASWCLATEDLDTEDLDAGDLDTADLDREDFSGRESYRAQ